MAQLIRFTDVHICPKSEDKMKPWHSFICSQCMGKGIDFTASYEEVTAYNKKNEKALLNKNTG